MCIRELGPVHLGDVQVLWFEFRVPLAYTGIPEVKVAVPLFSVISKEPVAIFL